MTKPTKADLEALAPPVDRALQDIEKRLIRELLAWVLVAVLVAVDIGLLAALWWRW